MPNANILSLAIVCAARQRAHNEPFHSVKSVFRALVLGKPDFSYRSYSRALAQTVVALYFNVLYSPYILSQMQNKTSDQLILLEEGTFDALIDHLDQSDQLFTDLGDDYVLSEDTCSNLYKSHVVDLVMQLLKKSVISKVFSDNEWKIMILGNLWFTIRLASKNQLPNTELLSHGFLSKIEENVIRSANTLFPPLQLLLEGQPTNIYALGNCLYTFSEKYFPLWKNPDHLRAMTKILHEAKTVFDVFQIFQICRPILNSNVVANSPSSRNPESPRLPRELMALIYCYLLKMYEPEARAIQEAQADHANHTQPTNVTDPNASLSPFIQNAWMKMNIAALKMRTASGILLLPQYERAILPPTSSASSSLSSIPSHHERNRG